MDRRDPSTSVNVNFRLEEHKRKGTDCGVVQTTHNQAGIPLKFTTKQWQSL